MENELTILSLLLVIVGVTMVLVYAYLKRKSRFANILILDLYRINQEVLSFLEQSWEVLELAGQVHWYGVVKQMYLGKNVNFLSKNIRVKGSKDYSIIVDEGDVKLDLSLVIKVKSKSENELIAEKIFQTFRLLLTYNITSKNMQFILSKERLERFQLFIHHDIKNLAQFISLLTNQVNTVQTASDKIALIAKLNKLLPSLSAKAKKITSHMQVGKESFTDLIQVDVVEQIKYYANNSEVTIVFMTEPTINVKISEVLLRQVITEIMENFKQHAYSMKKEVNVRVYQQADYIILNFKVQKEYKKMIPVERMFEPFWTTSNSGMGLGLFITREMLKEAGGKIDFIQNDNELNFNIEIPAKR